MKGVVLFDLDGTLCEPRKTVSPDTVSELRLLLRNGYKVGIVTGSGLDYITEQFERHDLDLLKNSGVELLPCNGTQRYLRPADFSYGVWSLVSPVISMREVLGPITWQRLQLLLADKQAHVIRLWPDLPYTGNFVSYRGSMVNWCPIGRDSGHEERKVFESFDRKNNFRHRKLEILREECYKLSIPVTVKLGGLTSFDIYPKGWDKSYALRWYVNESVWFVGDRVGPDGNDHEIYEAVKKSDRGFEVKDPADIHNVVHKILSTGV